MGQFSIRFFLHFLFKLIELKIIILNKLNISRLKICFLNELLSEL